MKKHNRKLSCLLAAVMLFMVFGNPSVASAAEGDPVLNLSMVTEKPIEGVRVGDEITVGLKLSRVDGSQEPYRLYGLQADLDFDNEYFEVSQLKTSGLKRPDGANWNGRWTCNAITADTAGTRRVRLLYVNTNLVFDMNNADTVNGPLTAGEFTLKAKKTAPGEQTAVTIRLLETVGSDLEKSEHTDGGSLIISFAAEGGSGSGSGGTAGSGSSGSGGGGSAGTSQPSSGGSHVTGTGSAAGAGIRFEELTDVPQSHWAAPAIQYVVEHEIASGDDEKRYNPDQSITRAEFARMAASAFGYTEEKIGGGDQLTDVSPGDWYYQPVMALYQAGVISGLGDGSFGANRPLSRQDMAVMIYRIYLDQNKTLPVRRDYAGFSDDGEIESYAQRAMWELYCADVLNGMGDGTLAPRAELTRAQMAVVLQRLLEEE